MEEAFNIACCDENVQEKILAKDFTHDFSKVEDYEASLNFHVIEEKTVLSQDEKERIKEEKKEAKRLKVERRAAKKAKIEADIAAKKTK